jgi:hypothetical protein
MGASGAPALMAKVAVDAMLRRRQHALGTAVQPQRRERRDAMSDAMHRHASTTTWTFGSRVGSRLAFPMPPRKKHPALPPGA